MLNIRQNRGRRDNALSPEEDEKVRDAIRSLRKTLGSQVLVAQKVGISQQSISRHLHGFPAGPDFADRVAKAVGLDRDVLIGRKVSPGTKEEPRLRDLPGWQEAEVVARRLYKFIPAAAWSAVGDLRTAKPPRMIAPEWIGTLAGHWARTLAGEGEETEFWREELMKRRHR